MGRSLVETVMGAVVLVVALGFVVFAYDMAQVRTIEGYQVKTAFAKVGGLNKGAEVRISGIKVGNVASLELDPETYDAVAVLSIRPDVKLPIDSVASIASAGMLGDKYVRLEPGDSETMIAADNMIEKTKDYRSLEDQVGDIIFLATGGDENN